MTENFKRLRGRMTEKGFNANSLANEILITPESFSHKLNGKTKFKYEEIIRICTLLSIPTSQIGKYFFADEVEKSRGKLNG